jgi:hypothetical protein
MWGFNPSEMAVSVVHDRFPPEFPDDADEPIPAELDWTEIANLERIERIDELVERESTPSLPIILFSAAGGIAGGIIGLYISLSMLQWPIEISAGVATLSMLLALGVSGATLSAITGTRAAPVNILFSCGLILMVLMFFALCTLVGAIGAALLLGW